MMSRIKSKLSKQLGDTLIETIAAILIVALSSVILLSAAAVSVNANKKVIAQDEKFNAQVRVAESMTEASSSGSLTIKSEGFSKNVDIVYFGKDKELKSYKAKSTGEGGG